VLSDEKASIVSAYRASQQVEGFLSRHEGVLLWHLATSRVGHGLIVEVGSWKGKSTIWLASGSKLAGNEKVAAIDPHTGSQEHKERYGLVFTYDEFISNMKKFGVSDWVVPIRETSRAAAENWAGDIRLVFIDGSHGYEDVREDFQLWFKRLEFGGRLALHDSYLIPGGPSRLVGELLMGKEPIAHVGFVGSITFLEKADRSLFQHARNLLLAFVFRHFGRVAGYGRPPFRFWLGLLLSATDRSVADVFWVNWQAFFRLKRSNGLSYKDLRP